MMRTIRATVFAASAGSHTLTFSAPVQDMYMAFVSIGQGGVPVTYAFDRVFSEVSEGQGSFGNGSWTFADGNKTLVGREAHGVIQFGGSISSLSWTTNPGENWHGFTLGAEGLAPPTATPEPITMTLLGTGLAGVAAARRRRRVS